jgi:hypothetical protein
LAEGDTLSAVERYKKAIESLDNIVNIEGETALSCKLEEMRHKLSSIQ